MRFDKVVLTECELGEVDVHNVSLGNDKLRLRYLVVLGAESLVGRE